MNNLPGHRSIRINASISRRLNRTVAASGSSHSTTDFYRYSDALPCRLPTSNFFYDYTLDKVELLYPATAAFMKIQAFIGPPRGYCSGRNIESEGSAGTLRAGNVSSFFVSAGNCLLLRTREYFPLQLRYIYDYTRDKIALLSPERGVYKNSNFYRPCTRPAAILDAEGTLRGVS